MKKLIAILLLLAIVFMLLLEVSDVGRYFFVDTVKMNNRQTKMIAHRGSSWLAVEGTAAAYEEAGQRSYYGLEADLQKTADGGFVICHDSNLKKLAGIDNYIASMTLDELRLVTLKDKFGRPDPNAKIITLEEYVLIAKSYSKHCFIELKADLTIADVEEMISIFRAGNYLENVTFLSMNEENLLYVREFLPNQSCQYVFGRPTDDAIEFALENRFDIAIQYLYLTKNLLQKIHDEGLKVNLWTINNKIAASVYASWGVDYITTNILE